MAATLPPWQCGSESQSAPLGIGIRGCASSPKVEWASCWGSLGSGGTWSGSLQLSHRGLCQAIRVGGVWRDLGVYRPPYSFSKFFPGGRDSGPSTLRVPPQIGCTVVAGAFSEELGLAGVLTTWVPVGSLTQGRDRFQTFNANNWLWHKKWLKH